MSFLPQRRQSHTADPGSSFPISPSRLSRLSTVIGPAVTSTVTAAAQTQSTTMEITETDTITQIETYQLPDVVVTETAIATAATKLIY
jgi:hypothetical protein